MISRLTRNELLSLVQDKRGEVRSERDDDDDDDDDTAIEEY